MCFVCDYDVSHMGLYVGKFIKTITENGLEWKIRRYQTLYVAIPTKKKYIFVECSIGDLENSIVSLDIKPSKSVRSSDSNVELNQYSAFRCPLVSIKSCLDIRGEQ